MSLWTMIRAKKLRYYEDSNFTGRILPSPDLADDGYRDRPAPRPDDWSGQVRGVHLHLVETDEGDGVSEEDEGGLQQQRHPGLAEEEAARAARDAEPSFDFDEEDADVVADKAVIDRLCGINSIARAHAINEGDEHRNPDNDLLPDF
jgi:type IV secretion system protein VirD4